jgi:hypothetical protein
MAPCADGLTERTRRVPEEKKITAKRYPRKVKATKKITMPKKLKRGDILKVIPKHRSTGGYSY